MNQTKANTSWLFSKKTLFALMVLLVVVETALINYYQQRVDQIYEKNSQMVSIKQDLYGVQKSIQSQIQEWKNTLLRGSNPDDFEHFKQAYLSQSLIAQEGLSRLKNRLQNLADEHSVVLVNLITQLHNNLTTSYNKALLQYQPDSLQSLQKVDKQVRGKDRGIIPQISKLEQSISHFFYERRLATISELKNYTYALGTLFFFVVLVSGYIIVLLNKLHNSKKSINRILDNINEGVLVLENDKVVFVSKTYTDITQTNLLGCSASCLYKHIHPQDRATVEMIHKKAIISKESNVQYSFRLKKENRLIWLEDNISFEYENRKIKRAYIITKDITKEKSQEIILRQNEEKYRTFVNLSSDFIYLKDSALRYIIVNQNLANFFQKDIKDIIGKTDFELLPYNIALQCRESDINAQINKKKIVTQEHIDDKIFESTKHIIEYNEEPCIAGVIRDITEQLKAQEEIHNLAFYDPLTKLPNKKLFIDRLAHAQNISRHYKKFGALLLLDIDHFKIINDTWGHEKGDKLLKFVANRLKKILHNDDTIAHFGGDTFVVILENLSADMDEAVQKTLSIANDIKRKLQEPYIFIDGEYLCTSSFGATIFCPDKSQECTPLECIKSAEIALYQAKEDGRNMVRIFEENMQEKIYYRFELETALKKALEKNEFELYYQPQVDTTRSVIGAEALLRWNYESNIISPKEFIPILETSELIVDVGTWVIEEGVKTLKRWQNTPKLKNLTLAVNVSIKQFEKENFVPMLKAIVSRHGIDATKLKLELTENLFMKNTQECIEKISQLKHYGVGISMDDFGTGYASLSYLKKIPITQLKIDQSFVRDILYDTSDATIVEMILDVGHKLSVPLLAEGVESFEQFEWLQSRGCEAFQGYYFDKPQTLTMFEKKTIQFKV